MSKFYEESHDEAATEEKLLAAARGQPADPATGRAASALLGRYRERIYRWCYGRVRNHELALDLAQDVLLSAYRGLPGFDGRSRFSSWLFAIARNRCLNALRRPALFEEGLELELMPDRGKGHDERLVEAEDEERLLDLIRRNLTPLDQQVLWLRCVEKMPVDGITRVLSIQESSGARAILQRARRRLRAAMETEEGDEARD